MQTPDLKAVAQKWVDEMNNIQSTIDPIKTARIVQLGICIQQIGFDSTLSVYGHYALSDPQEEQGGQG